MQTSTPDSKDIFLMLKIKYGIYPYSQLLGRIFSHDILQQEYRPPHSAKSTRDHILSSFIMFTRLSLLDTKRYATFKFQIKFLKAFYFLFFIKMT